MYKKLFKIFMLMSVAGVAVCFYLVQTKRAGNGKKDASGLLTRVTGKRDAGSDVTGNGQPDERNAEKSGRDAGSDVTGNGQPDDQGSGRVAAYVCGAVVNPGVYELKEGSRLDEYIKAAGGFTEEALTTSENLARFVKDGEKIFIPKLTDDIQPAVDGGASNQNGSDGNDGISDRRGSDDGDRISGEDELININTASAQLLVTLGGIGEVKAQQIIEYRKANDGFSCIEDIMKVDGIKESVFNKIKDKITV